MRPDDSVITPADTSDVPAYLNELDQFAQGLQTQAIASVAGTAMGGHPNPTFFNGRAAALMKAAAELLRKHLPAELLNPPKPEEGTPAVGGVGDPTVSVPPPNPKQTVVTDAAAAKPEPAKPAPQPAKPAAAPK